MSVKLDVLLNPIDFIGRKQPEPKTNLVLLNVIIVPSFASMLEYSNILKKGTEIILRHVFIYIYRGEIPQN